MADSLLSTMFSPFSQTIGRFLYDPTTNWQRFFNPQVVFNYNPQDEPIEAHVLSRVGSYGAQISTLIDAIDVLQSTVVRSTLDPGQRAKLEAFDTLRDSAQDAVDEFRGKVTEETLIEAAIALRKRNPQRADDLRRKLDAALKGDR